MKKFEKNTKGITLIALVITIIVLLILSSVGIYLSLGNNGIFTKAQEAKEKTQRETATEKINLKITTAQMNSYAENQEIPTLKELSLILKEDSEISYVTEESKVASAEYNVPSENPSAIYTKLKDYNYEFGINSSLQLASIDGVKVADSTGTNSNIQNSTYIKDFTPNVTLDGIFATIDANATAEDNQKIKGYIFLANNKVKKVTEESSIMLTLNYNTDYKIEVIAIDEDGNIKKSKSENIKTAETVELLVGTDLKENITGGYSYKQYETNSYDYCQFVNNTIRFAASGSGNRAIYSTNKKIDISTTSTLIFDIYADTNYSGEMKIQMDGGVSNTNQADYAYAKNSSVSGTTTIPRQEITVDVSDLKGEYFIKSVIYHGTNVSYYGAFGYIYKITMK